MAEVIATDEEPDIGKDWMPTFLFCTSRLKFFFFNIFIEIQIICTVELVSGYSKAIQLHTHTYILF